MEGTEERKKRYLWHTCTVCGHTWRSYSTGKRVVCPACYEKRTGKKLGKSAEDMAELRSKRKNHPEPEKRPADPPREEGGFLHRLMNKELF